MFVIEQKIMAGEHSFKPDELDRAVKFAKYLKYVLRIQNVITASYTPEGICFGDLKHAGLLEKSYIPGSGAPDDCDPHGIEWTVVGDIEFTIDREDGKVYRKGDVIEWAK